MAKTAGLVVVLVLLSCVALSLAKDYTVGDTDGWSTGTDYTAWATGKTFAVGDTLVFNYGSGAHSVAEVSSDDYKSCSAANAIASENTGTTKVALKAPGTRYFICGIPGHCDNGMKLQVTVGGGAGGATGGGSTTTPSTSTPTTPGTTTTPTTTTTTEPSSSSVFVPSVTMFLFSLMTFVMF